MKTISLLTFAVLCLVLILACFKNPADSFNKEEHGTTKNGYFFITSPEAGSRINLDSMLDIVWIASNKVADSPNVRISLLKDSAILKTLTPSTSNSGSYSYIPERLGSGKLYRIKICTTDTSQFDISSFFEFYSVYSGTFTMTHPSSGYSLMLGRPVTLQWTYADFPGPRVRLDLYCDTAFLFTIVESMPTTMKSYPWGTVTSPRGTNNRYRIKLTSEKDESLYSYSDYFTIKSIYNGAFIFKAPVSKTEYASGSVCSILWDTTGSPGLEVSLQLFKQDTLICTIVSATTDNGKYDWILNKGMTTGSDYRIKIVSTKDPGLFAMSGYFTINGIDADNYESDNGGVSSHQLAVGEFENHSITWNDTDRIRFEADSGSSYLLQSTCLDFFRINGTLYYSSETSVIDTFSSSVDGRLCRFWNCGKSGEYHAVITSRVAANSGVYAFGVYKFNPSEIVSFTSPYASSEITAGTKVMVSWIPDSLTFGPSVKLDLYRGSDRVMSLSSVPLPNSGNFEWAIPAGFLSANDYSLHLINGSDNRICGNGPAFSITGLSPDQFENDNKRSTVPIITLGNMQEHSIAWNDTDWVRFSARSGSRYIFLMQCADSFAASMSLFRDSSAQLLLTGASDSKGHFSTVWNCPSGTDYCIRITASIGGSFGRYNFNVIEFDSLNSIKFTSPGSSITLLRNTTLAISWLADAIITGDTVSLTIYRNNSPQIVLASKHPAGTPVFTWIIPDSLPPANSYRIRIANVANPLLYGYSPKFVISDLAPDGFENDGTSSNAAMAILDSIQNHNIIFDDTDFIKIVADSATQYLFNVNGYAQFRVSGSLYPEQAASPALSFSSNTNGQYSTIWPCPKTGTYYFRITGYSAANTGSYSFKASRFNPESVITFLSPVAGTSWFVDSTYLLRWISDKNLFGGSISVSLYRESGTPLQIEHSVMNNDSLSWKLPCSLSTGSDYRIKLVNTVQPLFYAISPPFTINGMPGDEYEPDNSWNQARPYTFGVTEKHNITWNDTDYIKFPVDSGSTYQIRVNGTNYYQTGVIISYENTLNQGYPFSSNSFGVIKELWSCQKNSMAYCKMFSYPLSSTRTGSYAIAISKFDPLKSVTFISPKAGSVFKEGISFDVEWVPDSNLLGDNIEMELFRSDSKVFSVGFRLANSGKANISLSTGMLLTANDYRMKIYNSSYAGFYGFSPFFTITGIDAAPDAYEVDNSSAAAKSLVFGEMQKHNLFSHDTDWIVFPIKKGDQYVLMADAPFEICVSVMQGSPSTSDRGVYLFQNQNRKKITGTTDGSCYISINASLASEFYTTYAFGVARIDSSNALKITSPTAGAVLTSGQDNILSWTGDTTIYGNDFATYIYKDNSLYTRTWFMKTGSHIWNANGAASGNNYRIKIESHFDTALYAFSPVFSIKGSDVDSYEPDGSPDKAQNFTLGTIQQHNFELHDTDWVKFYAQSGSEYVFQGIKDISSEMIFSLFDSAQMSSNNSILTESSSRSGDTVAFSWSCATTGTYYVKCFMAVQYVMVNYRLKINRFDSTQAIEVSEPAQGAIWTAKTSNQITWTPKDENFGARITIVLWKGNTGVDSRTFTPNTGSMLFSVSANIENGADYRISISRESTFSTKNYYSRVFSITGGIDPDSYEPDNSKNQASALLLNEVQHRTLTPHDTDWVQFQAETGTYIFQDSTTCVELEKSIYFSNENSPALTYKITTGQIITEWTCTKTGTCYFRMIANNGYSTYGIPGGYSVKVTKK